MYEEHPDHAYVAEPKRVLLGAIVAPTGASLIAIGWGDPLSLWLFAMLSTMPLFLPAVMWRLGRTKYRFLTCVIVGGVTAPGICGYALGIVGALVVEGGLDFLAATLLFAVPLGIVGGMIFWLCAVWKSDVRHVLARAGEGAT